MRQGDVVDEVHDLIKQLRSSRHPGSVRKATMGMDHKLVWYVRVANNQTTSKTAMYLFGCLRNQAGDCLVRPPRLDLVS
jgi:hypothetical protein